MIGSIVIFSLGICIGVLIGKKFFGNSVKAVPMAQMPMPAEEMTRALAHEVRNPLNTIKMNVELLREEYGENPKFARVENEIARVVRVVQSFLQYTKLPTPLLAKMSLNATIAEVAEHFKVNCPPEITLSLQLAPDLPDVFADSALIIEIIQNLLQNALEASTKGTILMESGFTKQSVFFSVSDQGSGIAPELLDKIFKPYFTTKKNGNGIGMAVVKRIVEAHGGAIQIQSRKDIGTRVAIELPRTR